MSTFTRERLQKMYLENKRFNLQQVIIKLTNDIKLDIINKNRFGYKTYQINFTQDKSQVNNVVRYLEDAEVVVNEIIHKLKEIFIDSDFSIESKEEQGITSLIVNWEV